MRVVVVGNGMVGSRFVEDLRARTPRAEITVVGAEEYEPYNRVLLSEVVAGAVDVAAITLPTSDVDGVRVLRGTSATALDRARRVLGLDSGEELPYDHLVLATGARARIPSVPGLERLPVGAHPLRSLDDAREIVAATVNARRAVVLGGGVLGLEVACGLRRRGLAVTLVHGGPHVMDRQLGEGAGAAALAGLTRLGIEQRTGVVAAEVHVSAVGTAGAGGGRNAATADGTTTDTGPASRRVTGVRLTDGTTVAADLLVLTAGTVPAVDLAERAGLEVRRGVVVGADLTTADPAVHAIGDCAEPPEGGTGLIAQGWDQSRRLAAVLAGADAPTSSSFGGTDVVRLKAHGLDVVAMGAPVAGARTVTLSDPAAGRHVEVSVADGAVVAVACVGAPEVGADLTTAYARATPVPADPAQLLLRPVRGAVTTAEPSPTLMPDRATVCRCNGVTKGDIVRCWSHGARSTQDVARATRATTGCGGCSDAVCGIVAWLAQSAPADVGEQPRTRPRASEHTPAPVA